MKKPRKEMRMKRRRMKAEIKYLRQVNTNLTQSTMRIEKLKVDKVIGIFEAGTDQFVALVQREMVRELSEALINSGCVTFATKEEPLCCGVKISASLKVLR